ncbi:MAG: hypothetical protein KBG28_08920, partial [Kofleriaceae bacterium]|nr:hypothetical protein [Kofleriaceae bacterium]
MGKPDHTDPTATAALTTLSEAELDEINGGFLGRALNNTLWATTGLYFDSRPTSSSTPGFFGAQSSGNTISLNFSNPLLNGATQLTNSVLGTELPNLTGSADIASHSNVTAGPFTRVTVGPDFVPKVETGLRQDVTGVTVSGGGGGFNGSVDVLSGTVREGLQVTPSGGNNFIKADGELVRPTASYTTESGITVGIRGNLGAGEVSLSTNKGFEAKFQQSQVSLEAFNGNLTLSGRVQGTGAYQAVNGEVFIQTSLDNVGAALSELGKVSPALQQAGEAAALKAGVAQYDPFGSVQSPAEIARGEQAAVNAGLQNGSLTYDAFGNVTTPGQAQAGLDQATQAGLADGSLARD